ncbi:MAG: sulfate ABC transporter permease subunit CysT [Verrucomicrobiota bacterium]
MKSEQASSTPQFSFPRLPKKVFPGFGISLGFTLFYLALIVLIPLAGVFIKSSSLTAAEFWAAVTTPRVLHSFQISFGLSLIAALINGVFGLIISWVLVRYTFPGKRFLDSLVDLPFALPTAVAGITLCSLYAPSGWIGQYLEEWGIKVSYTPLGILIALIFIGTPFVVRTLQPVLEDMDTEVEEAAISLGAGRFQTFLKVIFPPLIPSLLTGIALAFARAVGEYGSVIFIAGNMPMKSEITPLMIVIQLEQYEYAKATAIAAVMLVISFLMLLCINLLQAWSSRHHGH